MCSDLARSHHKVAVFPEHAPVLPIRTCFEISTALWKRASARPRHRRYPQKQPIHCFPSEKAKSFPAGNDVGSLSDPLFVHIITKRSSRCSDAERLRNHSTDGDTALQRKRVPISLKKTCGMASLSSPTGVRRHVCGPYAFRQAST
jgi:hypothetical protein